MSEIFSGIEGVEVIVDDLLILDENQQQHNERLKQVLDRARQKNLKLNKEKSQIALNEISYIGHILSKEGLNPDPKIVQAITEMNTKPVKISVDTSSKGLEQFSCKTTNQSHMHQEL